MILDCLHCDDFRKYISHSIFGESASLINSFSKVGIVPERVIFTGMACTIDYTAFFTQVREVFPERKVEPGFDGLCFYVN